MRKIKTLVLILLLTECVFGTIRYVSKTGSSTPPYTSWETASDSIQKCLDICVDGDTVIVANGVYKESLIINAAITFIGSSMDSCVIDGRGLAFTTLDAYKPLQIKGFQLIGKSIYGSPEPTVLSNANSSNEFVVSDCKILNAAVGLYIGRSNAQMNSLLITDVNTGILSFCWSQNCNTKLSNSLIVINPTGSLIRAWESFDGGNPTIKNNIIYKSMNTTTGHGITYVYSPHNKLIVENNLISGFLFQIYCPVIDTAYITNNVLTNQPERITNDGVLRSANSQNKIKNNIFSNNKLVIYPVSQPKLSYNIFWNNKFNIIPPYSLDTTDIITNPMFVCDTGSVYSDFDYHLQAFSPGIDTGDPSVLDIDGSRSDIGMYGGPLGQSYTYLDLPPNPPRNIQYTANINEKKIIFTWKKNNESDFKEYHVFRDTVQGFTPDSAHLYLILPDSTLGDTAQFIDTYSGENAKYYYRIIATDNQENESSPSDEISVIITGVDIIDVEIVTDYRLYQNYPNPFNPNTVIGYQLAVGSYVKVMVYDIKGELLEVLVNENKPAGYYEVEFNAGKYASGIYLYRIEAIDESGIPRFMDMKKMMLVK
ncbi:MAG: hypothetical protein AB9882_12700 [Ignavibacteriaceae bacterium]